MAKLPESTAEWRDYYQQKYDRAMDNYQCNGDRKYDTEAYKMSIIVDAFDALLDRQQKRINDQEQRKKAMRDFIAYHVYGDRVYTRDEVESLLWQSVRF